MYLFEVGHLIISAEHIIMAEDAEKEPEPRSLPEGVLRLTVETGRVIDLKGELASRVRRHLRQLIEPDPEPAPRRPSVGRTIHPKARSVDPPGALGHGE